MTKRLVHAIVACVLVVCFAPGARVLGTGISAPRQHVGRGSVAAGREHSVIATPEGRVSAWGGGRRGQIGDGALVDRWLPTPVPNLDGIVSVTAGAAHTVAVTTDGEVYAWGANTFGRLGDGTRKRRARPVRVRGLANVTTVAAGRAHTLALTADGRVFAWGRNTDGQLGIGSKATALVPVQVRDLSDITAIAAGDSHSFAVTRSGRLYAWGSNQFSMLGDGTTKDRTRPVAIALADVVSVAGGAAHSLALLRNGSVFSWGRGVNGELGTGSVKVASTPKIVSGLTATAVAAGRHFSAAIREDGQVVAWGANESGQLGDHTTTRRLRPVIVDGLSSVTTLALGDAHAIAVTASGDVRAWGEGGSGRLGTGALADRSTPSEIIADIPDWGSDASEEPPDLIPPSIVATTTPPLSQGWMTTPVTVSFACADDVELASCSSPVTVAGDGYAQQITGTAVDRAGNRATASVFVNLDLNPPALSIDEPADQSAIDAGAVIVAGQAIDLASGLADARCNGEPAAIVDGLVRCAVQLHPGRNEIILHAVDVAGHNSSAAITVMRIGAANSLTLSPATRAMVMTEDATLSLRDDFGAIVDQATWSTSDEAVVVLSESDPPVLTAVGIGSATITAEKNGVTATAAIEVSESLAAGETRWTLPSLPGFVSESPLFANRVDASVPAMFTVESQDWGEATLRAVTADGEVLWQQHSPGVPLMGDSFGGVLAGVYDVNDDFRAYLRLGGGSIRPWRYESPGFLDRPAQAHDGTIYAIEHLPGGLNIDGDAVWDKYAVVIDGATGRLISRTLFRREVDEFISDRDGDVLDLVPPVFCRTRYYDWAPDIQGPIVGTDGRGYFIVRRHELRKRGGCTEPFLRRPDRTITMGIDLVITSPTAAPQTVNIFSTSCDGTLGTTLPCDLPVRAYQVLPDGIGGTLVTWERGTQLVDFDTVFVQRSMSRVNADGAAEERTVPPQFWLELIGQAGTALAYDDGWRAIDVTSGATLWSSLLPGLAVLAARPDGGLATLDVRTGELKITNAIGEIESTQPFGLDWRSVQLSGDWIGRRGSALTAVVGDFPDATRWSPLRGNAQNQMAAREPGLGIFAKTHLAKSFPLDGVRYRHASIRIVPHDQKQWLARVPMPGIDEYGNHFFTIGAGSGDEDSSAACNGVLVSALNRPNDYGVPPWDPLELLPYPTPREDAKILDLILLDSKYGDDLPYACRPEVNPGFYNSNSYTHGLINAAGLPEPGRLGRIPSLAPGWLTPVPVQKFQ